MPSLEGRKYKQGTSWRVVYRWNGSKEHFKIGFTSKRVAQQQRARVEAILASGMNPNEIANQVKNCNISLSRLLQIDIEWCRPRRQPRTIELNERAIKLLIRHSGDLEITRITKEKINEFLNYLRTDLGHRTASVNICLKQLKTIFQRAVEEHDIIKVHPFRSLKPHAEKRTIEKPRFLTVKQVQYLIDQLQDSEEVHFRRLIQFYLWTGCRRNEATDLVWSDIDYQSEIFYLGQSDSQTKLRRLFPLTDRIKKLLDELRQDRGEVETVFWRFAGNVTYVNWKLQKIRNSFENLPDNLTPHTLRRTFASHLVMNGVDLTTIAALMGHSTTKVTEQYAHLQPDHKRIAADRLPF